MATRTDRLVVELTSTGDGRIKASLVGVEQGLQRVTREGDRANSTLGTMQNILGAIAVGATVAFVRHQLDMASALGDTASMLSINVEQLQEYHHIGRQVGITQETMNNSLRRFQRRAAEAAQGMGPLVKTVDDLGFAITDQSGRVLDAETLLNNFAEALKRVDDPAAQLRYAFAAFDTDGGRMLNMLRRNREELDKWRSQLREQGGLLSEEDIQKASDMANQLTNLSTVWGTQLTSAIIAAEPIISGGVALLERASAGMRTVFESLRTPEKRTDAGHIQREMDTLRRQQMQLVDQMQEARAKGRTALADQLLQDVNDINEQLIRLQRRLDEINGTGTLKIDISKGVAGFRDLTDAEEKFLDSLLREEAAIKRFNQAWAQLIRLRKEVGPNVITDERLKTAGEELSRIFRQEMDSIRKEGADTFERDLIRSVQNWGEAFTDTLARAVSEGKLEFSSLIDAIEYDLARILIRQQITAPILSALFPDAGTSSGTRAAGGPVSAGRPYLVGEMGPELFVPSRSGQIVPNGELGGGTSVQVVQNFDFRGAGPDSVPLLRAEAERIKRETVAEVFRQIERGGGAARAVGRR